MDQTLLVASVDLIPVLIIEEGSHINQSFPDGAPDGGSIRITSLARGNLECRVKWAYFGNALSAKDVAHVDRPNRRSCRGFIKS